MQYLLSAMAYSTLIIAGAFGISTAISAPHVFSYALLYWTMSGFSVFVFGNRLGFLTIGEVIAIYILWPVIWIYLALICFYRGKPISYLWRAS